MKEGKKKYVLQEINKIKEISEELRETDNLTDRSRFLSAIQYKLHQIEDIIEEFDVKGLK